MITSIWRGSVASGVLTDRSRWPSGVTSHLLCGRSRPNSPEWENVSNSGYGSANSIVGLAADAHQPEPIAPLIKDLVGLPGPCRPDTAVDRDLKPLSGARESLDVDLSAPNLVRVVRPASDRLARRPPTDCRTERSGTGALARCHRAARPRSCTLPDLRRVITRVFPVACPRLSRWCRSRQARPGPAAGHSALGRRPRPSDATSLSDAASSMWRRCR